MKTVDKPRPNDTMGTEDDEKQTRNKIMSSAQARRFLIAQRRLHPNAPATLWNRFEIFIACTTHPVTFEVWLNR